MTPDPGLKFIPSHDVALWLLEGINRTCRALGINPSVAVRECVYTILVVAVALLLGWLMGRIIVAVTRRLLKLSKGRLAAIMIDEHVTRKCSHILPPVVMLAFLPWAFQRGTLANVLDKLLWIYTIVVAAIAINALLTLAWTRYNDRQNTKNLPLKGILNTGQGIVWIVAVIIIVSMLVNKSPMVLLGGLGAFAAALMLVFKDSILGFVAGLQLSQNDMVRMGDWIEVPGTPANGNVMDMTLTTVKVRNFDNTIVTLPPYMLVSQSFKNWRGMQELQSRRIKFTLTFDFMSVRPIGDDERKAITARFPVLADFVARATPVDTPAGRLYIDPANRINGSLETNLGLFRAYVCAYVMANDQFDHKGDLLIYTLDTTPEGVPLQIYCFSTDYKWTPFEAVQSALTEHLVAVAPQFGLNVHNALTDSTFSAQRQAAVAAPERQAEG